MTDAAPGNGWLQAGIIEVPLPSGYRVRGVLPMLHTLVRRGMLPTHLAEVALRSADPQWMDEPEQADERAARWREYLDTLVCAFPSSVCAPDGDEWVPVTLTRDDLATMDPRDIDVMEDLVLRIRTPEQVRAGVTKEVAQAEVATFPDERVSDAASEDGEAVEPAAVGAAEGD